MPIQTRKIIHSPRHKLLKPGTVCNMIYNCLKLSAEPITRREISNRLGIPYPTITKRIGALINEGLVSVVGNTVDELTQRTTTLLTHVEEYEAGVTTKKIQVTINVYSINENYDVVACIKNSAIPQIDPEALLVMCKTITLKVPITDKLSLHKLVERKDCLTIDGSYTIID